MCFQKNMWNTRPSNSQDQMNTLIEDGESNNLYVSYK